MKTWIAFLRGINVGGNNRLPMKSLVQLLEKLGCAEVQTYIQSGNAVFRSNIATAQDLEGRIAKAIAKGHGFEPRVLVLSAADLDKAIHANPFPEAQANHKSLHFYFLAATPKSPDSDTMSKVKAFKESFVIAKRVFYLHAPDGIGKSKLAERAEKLLGVAATARNWQTVSKVSELARALK